jgi:Protein of unknown function (DUF3102)
MSHSRSYPRKSSLAEHAAEIRRLGRRVVGDVIEIGARLTECKRLCGHGHWLPWLDREFGWTDKTAENFINVYKLSGKLENFSNLELPISGLYSLAAPSTPEMAKTDIIKRAQSGEVIPLSEVKRTIDAAKGRKTAKPKPRDTEAALKPSHDRAARKLLNQFGEAPVEVQRQFLQLTRDDIGPASAGELVRKDARIEGLQAEKWRLEIKITGLESEIAELKNANREPASAARCEICREKKRAVPRRVFVCDCCAEIHELETSAEAAPLPADDGLDIPEFLRRTAP